MIVQARKFYLKFMFRVAKDMGRTSIIYPLGKILNMNFCLIVGLNLMLYL